MLHVELPTLDQFTLCSLEAAEERCVLLSHLTGAKTPLVGANCVIDTGGERSGFVRAQGLGFPQLSNMRTLPAFFNMMTQGLLDAPTFAIYLNPNPAAEPAGEVQFGGMNTARFTGSVVWTPVIEKS